VLEKQHNSFINEIQTQHKVTLEQLEAKHQALIAEKVQKHLADLENLDNKYKTLLSDQQAASQLQFKLASEERQKQERAYALALSQLQDSHKEEYNATISKYE
jgi:hypothetical protein